jgi:hypothetical protein
LSFGEIDSKYAIAVRLQTTNLATTYTNYDVTLYENGNYRDYSSFSTDNEIGFKTVYFPITEEEAEYYNTNFQQLDLINIFTIEVKAKTEYFFTKNIFINTTEDPVFNGYCIYIDLKPTLFTTSNTEYIVELYENGLYRDSSYFSTKSSISSDSFYYIYFVCSEEEYQLYHLQYDLRNIFNVQISPK